MTLRRVLVAVAIVAAVLVFLAALAIKKQNDTAAEIAAQSARDQAELQAKLDAVERVLARRGDASDRGDVSVIDHVGDYAPFYGGEPRPLPGKAPLVPVPTPRGRPGGPNEPLLTPP